MSPLEYLQYLLLVAMSWMTPTGDLYDSACLLTKYLFREYHEGVCPKPLTWEKVQAELEYEFFYPSTGHFAPYPLVILVHGSSSANSVTMQKRRAFFLQLGYAVMVPDSFTEPRVKAGLALPLQKKGLYAPGASAPDIFTDSAAYQKQVDLFYERVSDGHAFLPAVRAADVFVALDAARKNPRIDSNGISIVGFSHGASTVLEALTLAELGKPLPGMKRLPKERLATGVRSIVLYYPSCQPGHYYAWHSVWPQIPTLMILGSQDELCRPGNCQAINRTINQRVGFPLIQVVMYNAPHNFDMEEFPKDYMPEYEKRALMDTLRFIGSH